MLTVTDISFSYGRKTVFEKLSFSVAPGECVVIAGPNGCGKSTALSVIAGALKPSCGTVSCEGKLGYVPQGSALMEDATVMENLRFFASVSHGTVPEKLPFSVDAFRKKKVSRLSGGMKKQVSIAAALLGDPDVILLDEPSSALDISFRDEMTELIKEWLAAGKAVVYVGHDPYEFHSFFNKIVFLDDVPVTYCRSELCPEGSDSEEFSRIYKNTLKNIRRK